MNKKTCLVAALFLICSLGAHSQIFQPDINPTDSSQQAVIQKENNRQDSISRIVMSDSLHLSQQAIAQIFSTRQDFMNQARQIRSDGSLLPRQQADQLRALLNRADATIKSIMGSDGYLKWGAMEQKRLLVIF